MELGRLSESRCGKKHNQITSLRIQLENIRNKKQSQCDRICVDPRLQTLQAEPPKKAERFPQIFHCETYFPCRWILEVMTVIVTPSSQNDPVNFKTLSQLCKHLNRHARGATMSRKPPQSTLSTTSTSLWFKDLVSSDYQWSPDSKILWMTPCSGKDRKSGPTRAPHRCHGPGSTEANRTHQLDCSSRIEVTCRRNLTVAKDRSWKQPRSSLIGEDMGAWRHWGSSPLEDPRNRWRWCSPVDSPATVGYRTPAKDNRSTDRSEAKTCSSGPSSSMA